MVVQNRTPKTIAKTVTVDATDGDVTITLPQWQFRGTAQAGYDVAEYTVIRTDDTANTVKVDVTQSWTLNGGVGNAVTVTHGQVTFRLVAPGAWAGSQGEADGTVDVTDLSASVRASLTRADSATQPEDLGTMAAETATDYLTTTAASGTYASRFGWQSAARKILGNAQYLSPPTVYSGTAPTITIGAANGSPTITSAILRAPKRLTYVAGDGATLDSAADPSFKYLGVAAGTATYGTSNPDWNLVRWSPLTGGGSGARWTPTIAFEHYGQAFEFSFKAFFTTHLYRIWIDGHPVTEDLQSASGLSVGSIHLMKVDFGSAAPRRVLVEMQELEFGGCWVEPTATITRAASSRLSMAVIGDSISGGSGVMSRFDVPLAKAAQMIGIDEVYNLSIGGTGYLTGAGTKAFRDRLPIDLAAVPSPDIVALWGGYNDAGVGDLSQIQAQVSTDIATTRTLKPNALIIILGCYTPGTPTSSTIQTCNAAISNAVTAAGGPAAGVCFLNLQDPSGVSSSAVEFVQADAYRIGDIVTNGDTLYECRAFKAPGAAFSGTNFRGVSVIHGTGKSGATTGDGNADIAVQSDGVHPTVAGAKIIGRWIAERLITAARSAA